MSIRYHYSGWTRRFISIASVAWIVLLLVSVIAIRARATPPASERKVLAPALPKASVSIGIKVRIVESKDANGIKTLTVTTES